MLTQFDAALHAWLSDAAGEDAPARARLLWLHEIRCQEYGAVAGSLGALVAAQAAGLGEEEVERMLALKVRWQLSLNSKHGREHCPCPGAATPPSVAAA